MAAASGYNVTLVEVTNALVEKAQGSIKKSLERVAKKQFKDNESNQSKYVSETASRITGSSDLLRTVKTTDLVIEAIVENIKVKHELFSSIDNVSVPCNNATPFKLTYSELNSMFAGGTGAHNIRIEYFVVVHR